MRKSWRADQYRRPECLGFRNCVTKRRYLGLDSVLGRQQSQRRRECAFQAFALKSSEEYRWCRCFPPVCLSLCMLFPVGCDSTPSSRTVGLLSFDEGNRRAVEQVDTATSDIELRELVLVEMARSGLIVNAMDAGAGP